MGVRLDEAGNREPRARIQDLRSLVRLRPEFAGGRNGGNLVPLDDDGQAGPRPGAGPVNDGRALEDDPGRFARAALRPGLGGQLSRPTERGRDRSAQESVPATRHHARQPANASIRASASVISSSDWSMETRA